jgi:hypothetical protein
MFKDFDLPQKYVEALKAGSVTMGGLAQDTEVQRLALEYFNKTDEGRRITDSLGDQGGQLKPTTFKGPEGFSNVIGVGANPVIEAMTRQNELLEEIKVILEESKPSSNGVPDPFTEKTNPASRTGNL